MPSAITFPGTYVDGDYTVAAPCGPIVPEQDPQFVREGDNTSYIFRQKWCQLGYLFTALPIDTPGPGGSVLVAETIPKPIGCYIVEWDRVWALVPATRVVFENFPYSYQEAISASGQWSLVEIPKGISSWIVKEYAWYAGASMLGGPLGFSPILATKAVIVNNVLYVLPPGSTLPPTPDAAGNICCEDSKIRGWMGNIQERATRYCKAATISPYTPP
jgi:hypothetical protein